MIPNSDSGRYTKRHSVATPRFPSFLPRIASGMGMTKGGEVSTERRLDVRQGAGVGDFASSEHGGANETAARGIRRVSASP